MEETTLVEKIEETVVTIPEIVDEKSKNVDPYAYLDKDFTSEKFKIEIKNMPKFYGISELKKLLNFKLKLPTNKIKMPRRNSSYIFICFSSEEERENAMKILNGFKWKGKLLTAIKAKPSPDPLVKKRQNEALSDAPNKMIKIDKSVDDIVRDSTIPLWNISYEEQLKQKQEDVRNLLKKLSNHLYHQNSFLHNWLNKQKEKFDGLPCELLDIRYSEQLNGYRNKCEFTVGMSDDQCLPVVGFRLSSYAKGKISVGPIENLCHISNEMKQAVKLFEQFVQSHHLKVFNPELHTGHFKQLTVRVAKDQLMLIVGIHPQDLTQEQLDEFKKQLIHYFYEGVGKEANVTSLYYQHLTKRESGGNSANRPIHLHGDTHIYDTILGLKFRISPEAFFQINTSCAEVLYNSAIELADPSKESTVVDVCCGTGTIGLCFAKHCSQVLGLEIISEAVHDAQENAKVNSIENAQFFAGKAEDILSSVFYKTNTDDVVTVVDPPRAGLHRRAIGQLRKMEKVKKLVYISCNPASAMDNFVQLGRPQSKTLFGEPLIPVKAVAVDMFPYTKHCELVIFFKRFNETENSSVQEDS